MKKIYLLLLVAITIISSGSAALAQTMVTYDFNSTQPLTGIEQVSGTAAVVTVAGLSDNGTENNTPTLRPLTVGSPNQTGVINLTSFPASSDYSVTWKEYITQGNTTFKKGFLLRGSGTGGYTTGIKQGYYFMVQNNGTTGSVNFRIMNSGAGTSISDLKNSGGVTIPGFAVNKACWFRASVAGNVLKFEYSMDGQNFTVGTTHTDASNLYTSGGTQLVYGIASGAGQYLYDDITFKSIAKGSSSVSLNGPASFIYNGTPQGPVATVVGSTGALTYDFTGTGTTVYGPSSMRPVMAGTYQVVATVAPDDTYAGAVSAPFAFTIAANPEMPVVSLRRPLSPTNPMWLIHIDVWVHQPQQIIDLIPEDIRPFVVMNIGLSTSVLGHHTGYSTAESWLNICAQNGIWAMVQPSSGIENSFPSNTDLAAYESLYKKYPNFIGYNFCEQSWGFDTNTFQQRLELFNNLLAMGHQYGGYLYINDSFSISNAPYNSVSKFKKNADFANATRVYKENLIFGNKFTHSRGYYDNESGALGAFLSGHAGHYAIRYDQFSWAWSGRGKVFGPEVVGGPSEFEAKSVFSTPEAVMGVPIVDHLLTTGATVIDGPEIPWQTTLFANYRLPAFNNMIADIYRKVQDGTIRIPSVEEVAARTKVVFVNDVDVNTTDMLYSDIYAMDGPLRENRTWFKKSGRYATIPQLFSGGAYETSLFTGAAIVNKSAYKTRWPNEQNKVDEFNSLYPKVSNGDMFVSRVGNSLYAYNPHINSDIATTASIPLQYNTCDSIALTFPAHTFSVINESGNRLQVYLNNYRTDKDFLWTDYPGETSWYTLQNTILPQFAVNPTDGTLRTSVIKVYGATSQPSFILTERGSHKPSTASGAWVDGIYTITVTHNGPVDMVIACAGSATGRQTAPSVLPLTPPVQPVAYAGEKQYEAEGALITAQAVIATNPKKYHGNGFVRFSGTSSAASSVKFNILDVETEGSYALKIRYSAPQGNVSKLDVLVNGTKISTPLFPATQTDTTWVLYTQKVMLRSGSGNTIELKANASGANINIDKIYLTKQTFPFSFVSFEAAQKNSSQIQLDWRVIEEQNLLTYEVLRSADGVGFTSVLTQEATNAGDSHYVKLDHAENGQTYFYKIKATGTDGVETFSNVVQVQLKTAVLVQAEAGAPGSDWETVTTQDLTYITPKTGAANSAYPGNASKVITYSVTFEKPGVYNLYAKVWVGPATFNNDSFYYGKGFGVKNPAADNNEWITCNGLAAVGYTGPNEVVSNAGNIGSGQWKWVNISRFNGGETPVSFTVPQDALTQTFQIGGREDGFRIDKFVFGSSDQTFTVRELEGVALLQAVVAVEGGDFEYNGLPHAATGFASSAGGNVEKLSPELSFTYTDANNTPLESAPVKAGAYTVTATFPGNSSYSPVSATASITISPRPLIITAADQQIECGSAVELGTTAFVADGLVSDDRVHGVSLNSSGDGVGTYPIVPGDATGVGLSNYTITYKQGTLLIKDETKPVITYTPTVPVQCHNPAGSYTIPVLVATDGCGNVNSRYTITGATNRSGNGADASGSFHAGTSIIQWVVDDGHGNQSTAQTTVTVNEPLTAAIPEVYAMNPAVDAENTIYTGYGPSSLTISVIPAGGTAPYTYKWNTGHETSALSVSAAGTYMVTVHDKYNCTSTASVVIKTQDVRCGNNDDKVTLCHNGKAICVASAAVQEHLDHGDSLGGCESTITGSSAPKVTAEATTKGVTIYPNPVQDEIYINFSEGTSQVRQIEILDLAGRILLKKLPDGNPAMVLPVANLAPGTYLIRVYTDKVMTYKFIKM